MKIIISEAQWSAILEGDEPEQTSNSGDIPFIVNGELNSTAAFKYLKDSEDQHGYEMEPISYPAEHLDKHSLNGPVSKKYRMPYGLKEQELQYILSALTIYGFSNKESESKINKINTQIYKDFVKLNPDLGKFVDNQVKNADDMYHVVLGAVSRFNPYDIFWWITGHNASNRSTTLQNIAKYLSSEKGVKFEHVPSPYTLKKMLTKQEWEELKKNNGNPTSLLKRIKMNIPKI